MSGQASQFRSVQKSLPSQPVSTPSFGVSISWLPGYTSSSVSSQSSGSAAKPSGCSQAVVVTEVWPYSSPSLSRSR